MASLGEGGLVRPRALEDSVPVLSLRPLLSEEATGTLRKSMATLRAHVSMNK